MLDLLINPTNTLTDFVYATKNCDIDSIAGLLDDAGVFEIEQINGVLIDTNKEEFLDWYRVKLLETKVDKVDYDQCITCHFDRLVVLFNNGRFPRKTTELLEKFKSGLRIVFDGNKISKIAFCYQFLKTENLLVHECEEYNPVDVPSVNFDSKELLQYDNDDVPF